MYSAFIVTYYYKFLFFKIKRIKFYRNFCSFTYEKFLKLYLNSHILDIHCYIDCCLTAHDVKQKFVDKYKKERNFSLWETT